MLGQVKKYFVTFQRYANVEQQIIFVNIAQKK